MFWTLLIGLLLKSNYKWINTSVRTENYWLKVGFKFERIKISYLSMCIETKISKRGETTLFRSSLLIFSYSSAPVYIHTISKVVFWLSRCLYILWYIVQWCFKWTEFEKTSVRCLRRPPKTSYKHIVMYIYRYQKSLISISDTYSFLTHGMSNMQILLDYDLIKWHVCGTSHIQKWLHCAHKLFSSSSWLTPSSNPPIKSFQSFWQ